MKTIALQAVQQSLDLRNGQHDGFNRTGARGDHHQHGAAETLSQPRRRARNRIWDRCWPARLCMERRGAGRSKGVWPGWTPPKEMIARRPDLPDHMDGGMENPLGARAVYLFKGGKDTLFRIHGTNELRTIGRVIWVHSNAQRRRDRSLSAHRKGHTRRILVRTGSH